jgi:hypothetical protein
MKIFNIIWKILLLVIGIIIMFLMLTSNDRKYESFLNCTSMNTGEVCAQLFSK